jgi:hypothetical protein
VKTFQVAEMSPFLLSKEQNPERSVATGDHSSTVADYIITHLQINLSSIFQITYLCAHDNRKITGYAVPHCRDKEVSLTSKTDDIR